MMLIMYHPDRGEAGELSKAKNLVEMLGLGETLIGGSYLTLVRNLRMILTKMTTAVTKITVDLY